MRRVRATIAGGLGSLLLVATLAACGATIQATSKPLVAASTTPTSGPAAIAATTRPGLGGPPASPILPLPSGSRPSGSPELPFPSGSRPSSSPSLPIPSRSPLATLSAGAVEPTSDGNCPTTHPIKAAQLGPLKSYFLSDNTAYSRTQANECFANEADAEAAGYRKAAR